MYIGSVCKLQDSLCCFTLVGSLSVEASERRTGVEEALLFLQYKLLENNAFLAVKRVYV